MESIQIKIIKANQPIIQDHQTNTPTFKFEKNQMTDQNYDALSRNSTDSHSSKTFSTQTDGTKKQIFENELVPPSNISTSKGTPTCTTTDKTAEHSTLFDTSNKLFDDESLACNFSEQEFPDKRFNEFTSFDLQDINEISASYSTNEDLTKMEQKPNNSTNTPIKSSNRFNSDIYNEITQSMIKMCKKYLNLNQLLTDYSNLMKNLTQIIMQARKIWKFNKR